jgi:hypothetical protein
MALGALISAYHEDDSGSLRALLPLSGRTLLEYQVRCAAAAGAAPVIALVDRVPQALQDAFERLRAEGVGVFPACDAHEAASRFEAGSTILVLADGIALPAALVAQIADEDEATVAIVPDDEAHAAFERIDGESRWAGIMAIDSELLRSTAQMLGDWDLQSTLLRRSVQEGALRVPVSAESQPVLVDGADQLADFQRGLLRGSRADRDDAVARFVLPMAEDFATERLMDSTLRADWMLWSAVALTLLSSVLFIAGWTRSGLAALLVSTPLDLVATRLAAIRLRPLAVRHLARQMLWPLAGLAMLSLGWADWRSGAGWGSLLASMCAAGFAQAAIIERATVPNDWEIWIFSRRNAIWLGLPFALFGAWTAFLIALLAYASVSFFLVQRINHFQGG